MYRSDGLIGLSSTRTSASPGAKGGVGISASFNTLFGSPVSRKINTFINTSWLFRRRLIPAGCYTTEPRSSVEIPGPRFRRRKPACVSKALWISPNLPPREAEIVHAVFQSEESIRLAAENRILRAQFKTGAGRRLRRPAVLEVAVTPFESYCCPIW